MYPYVEDEKEEVRRSVLLIVGLLEFIEDDDLYLLIANIYPLGVLS